MISEVSNPDIAFHYLSKIKHMDLTQLLKEISKPHELVIRRAKINRGEILSVYAPFDHLNRGAKIAIIGLSPGRFQMQASLIAAHENVTSGASYEDTIRAVRNIANFSGGLRRNLILMLDFIGLNRALGKISCAELWDGQCEDVHFTSVLRYPVLINGENYSGIPSAFGNGFLYSQCLDWLLEELRALPNAVFVPLGAAAGELLAHIAPAASICRSRILDGLPHPSGANIERIYYFLGLKPRALISRATDCVKIDAARARLASQVSSLKLTD
jgi:hypothetical protein